MSHEHRILIVDDEPDMRTAIRRSIYQPGLTFLEATDGVEAMKVFGRHDLDAVVSDYDMPRMDGLELLQQVRLVRPDCLRILLTGRSDVHVAIRALNEGAVHRFLLKPWDRIDLRGIVEMGLHAQGATPRAPTARG